MYIHTTRIRVRYGETDQMGYLYHGNYPDYFEVARTETIRGIGVSYKSLENQGVLLPVRELQVEYLKPAFYDEVLEVKTLIPEMPNVRMLFEYEVYNSRKELITRGSTVLVFVDAERKRPRKAPEDVINLLKPYFNSQ